MTADLTKGKPLPVIFRFSLPVIAGNLFQLFYTLADTIIVGQTMGEKSLSAVGGDNSFRLFHPVLHSRPGKRFCNNSRPLCRQA